MKRMDLKYQRHCLYLELMGVPRLSSEMEGFRLGELLAVSCRPFNRGGLKDLVHCPQIGQSSITVV